MKNLSWIAQDNVKNECSFDNEGHAKLINEAYADIQLCKRPLYFIRFSEISMGDLIGKVFDL